MKRYGRRKSKKSGPVKSKKVSFDGITFASGLELFMYRALKKAKIKVEYESERFTLCAPFILENEVWERPANGKGTFKKKETENVRAITYKPDFIIRDDNGKILVIIETKGRANEAFPIRWKLFKRVIADSFPGVTIFKPQKQAECDETVQRILEILRS